MSRTEKQVSGTIGENIALKHLVKQGYRILERNLRKPWGEIDIIAEKRGVLVFVEVKALMGSAGGPFRPEDHFSREKLRRVRRSAELYVQALGRDVPCRIDLVAIELEPNGSVRDLRHIEGVEEW
jgi:putative endonuclease